MIETLKDGKRLANHILYNIKQQIYMNLFNSYSQKQEDILIGKFFNNKKTGFYIDIGANDPIKMNNTYRFYKIGWRGILIEPHPKKFTKITETRPQDLKLKIGIGLKEGIIPYYEANPDSYSTFSLKEIEHYLKDNIEIINTRQVLIEPLSFILDKYCNKPIDFLSIDTEGFDLDVLKSNNWDKYRPKLICIETDKGKPINEFMKTIGYKESFNNGLNSFFIEGG